MKVLKLLVASRKAWLAVLGAIAVLAVEIGLDERATKAVLQAAIVVLDSVLIGSIAVEDAAEKLGSERVERFEDEPPKE